MTAPVIVDFNNVSKRYCKNLKRSLWYGAKDVIKELTIQSKEEDTLRKDEFWAIRDATFQLRRGESIGLIGHNGAGKTTILKLINGLIKPTKGSITVDGSIRALIALGTGFNPVLTGRENIRIAGAVLGYTRKEMDEKFDEIIEFSEVGDFIDAPVQSYSSGMLARLGFAVAVHTNPDILLVDEVLSVGDLNFAIKCYRKISDYRNQGGAILLVSHNIYSIRTNCDRGIWLERGKIQRIGEVNEVCDAYEKYVKETDKTIVEQRYADESVEIVDVVYSQHIQSNEEFLFEFTIKTRRNIEKPIIGISIFDMLGHNLVSNTSYLDNFYPSITNGFTRIRIKYDKLSLAAGQYHVNLTLAEQFVNNQLAALVNCYKFEVKDDHSNLGAGFFRMKPRWECRN